MNGQWTDIKGGHAYLSADGERIATLGQHPDTLEWALQEFAVPVKDGSITAFRTAIDLPAAQAQAGRIIEARIRERVTELQAVLGESVEPARVEWVTRPIAGPTGSFEQVELMVYGKLMGHVGCLKGTKTKGELLKTIADHCSSIAAGCRAEIERLRTQGEEAV
jgi:hypothetical protein